VRPLALLLALTLFTTAETARADKPDLTCQELPCSVIRNCSSTGVACLPSDRGCAAAARDHNLELKCEQQCDEGKTKNVYCPPDSGRSDSNVVWMLLGVAGALAVGGISGALLLLRKKKAP